MSRVKVDVELNQSKFQAGMEKVGSSLEGIKGLIEATFVLDAVKELTSKMFDYADSIDKASLRLHLSTDEVQALSVAARDAGSSLESIEAAYRKIETAKAKAMSGDKEAIQNLKDLGVNAEQFKAKGGTLDMLGTIASNASKGGEREQVAMQNIGLKSVAGDLTALGDSVKDLHDKVTELKAAGQIISESDIDKLVEAKDEFEALEQSAMVTLAPIITELIEGILHGVISLEDLFQGTFQSIEKMAEDTINFIENLSKHKLENLTILGSAAAKGYAEGGIGNPIGGIIGMVKNVMTAQTIGNTAPLGTTLFKDASDGLNGMIDKYQADSDKLDARIAGFIANRQKQRAGDNNAEPIDTTKPVGNKKLYSDSLTASGNFLGASFGHAGFVASQLDLQKRQVDIGRQQLDESKKQTNYLLEMAQKAENRETNSYGWWSNFS